MENAALNTETEETSVIRGFITNLGKYNEGCLVGEWIEFPIDEDELEAVYKRIGIDDEYEEFFFTDWDCDFDAGFGEYESIEKVNELAEALQGADGEIIQAIIEATGYGLEYALENQDDAVFYRNMDLEDVAYELVQECYFTKDTPEIFERYFDYKAFARDLSFDGYTEVSNGTILLP